MKYILSLVMILTTTFCFGQSRVVSGNVYTYSDLPLKNIKVSAKKANSSTMTDSLGNFTIVCLKNDKLTFFGNGFKQVNKSIKNIDSVKVKMVIKNGEKFQEIAVGYGHVSKENLLNSAAKLSQSKNNFSNYTDVFAIIQGRFSGVKVTGEDGSNNRKVSIRGDGTSFNLDNNALYVVDGYIVDDIFNISPVIVKSIDILKDASIYGSRGANGAVIITTK